ncbi:DUF2798 domain-containing protein [Paenibacillus sp. OAS669]|uniref:DUF2798 domain-containing protein n=1 Tax=Paenibacillus sp. OAS669 TaxID=2663821 RepID=UPI00178A0DE4|nr:DUF2798 domain-containing protein [Paenibacillus sp. OAS669]MBE1442426.1 putative neutral ceramidase superfamily lipid hydrolase [Paenibacillus sp. OAS669]
MPTTKKQGICFGLMMCCGMVIAMTFYNLLMNDLLSGMTFMKGMLQLIVTFLVAAALELLVVSPIAGKVVSKLPFDKSKKLLLILAMSGCMVLGMVTFMSFYGLITASINNGLPSDSLIKSYLLIFIKNLVFAFPLQLLIMGPLVRFLFSKMVRARQSLKAA